MKKKVKNLIVGCGLSGVTIANKIATELDEEVLIIDARNHIAGNCYDFRDNNQICIHKYGAHIFHTDNKVVWDYVNQFAEWYPYMHEVIGIIDGTEVPIPFNLNSLYIVFPHSLAGRLEEKLIANFGYNIKVPILKLRESKDTELEFLAEYIYQKVFLGYTLKQWGLTPEEIDPTVTARVPVYISRDNRYFQNKYQAIPVDGYSALVEKMLSHPKIQVALNTNYQEIKETEYERLIYTGAIDEFFNYKYGELPYRSLMFKFVEFKREFYQKRAVVNYPENYDFTRIIEYKHFLHNKSDKTVVSFEYPLNFEFGKNERYYPILVKDNIQLYQKYLQEANKLQNVYFLGRLGDYQYFDMDKTIERALFLYQNLISHY